MNVIIVGCGRVGAELALRLFQKNHNVSVVENNLENFNNLHADFRGRVIEGDAMNADVLRRAGIEQADALAAVTNSDSLNAVIAHIARSAYQVKNVVTRNYNPEWIELHEAFGFQTVSSSSWGAQRIEELIHGGKIRTVFSSGNGEVELYEFAIPPRWDGKSINQLLPDSECCLVSITRAGSARLPGDFDIIQSDDIIMVSATFEGIENLRARLEKGGEE
jgi:trk system potassium uptake protein TrkA